MNTINIITGLVLFIATQTGRTGPLDTWIPGILPTNGYSLFAVASGNGQFAAVGVDGVVLTSSDGVNWVERGSNPGLLLRGIAFGLGQFVTVGWTFDGPGTILTSTDGTNWAPASLPPQPPRGFNFTGIAYGNGRFVAVGLNFLLTSTNGVDWAETEAGIGADAVGFGGGKFVTAWGTSTDGVNWSHHGPIGTNGVFGIAYGNGQYVAVADANYIIGNNVYRQARVLTSPDGVNWIERLAVSDFALYGIHYASGQFVAVGYPILTGGAVILTSGDGLNWTRRQPLQDVVLSGITFENGHFVAVGSGTLESGNIITLSLSRPTDAGPLSLSLTGPIGLGYTIQSSSDLISWRSVTNISTVQPTTVVFAAVPATSDHIFYRAFSQ